MRPKHTHYVSFFMVMQSTFNVYGQYLDDDSSFISSKGVPPDEWSRGSRIPMERSKIFDLKKTKREN